LVYILVFKGFGAILATFGLITGIFFLTGMATVLDIFLGSSISGLCSF
jgi:hypothetical protein